MVENISIHKKAGDRFNWEITELISKRDSQAEELDEIHAYAGLM